MPTTIRDYILNNPGEPPNWSQREYNLFTDIISKLPGANDTYTAGRHTHSKLVSPDESYNPAVRVDNNCNVGINADPEHNLDIHGLSGVNATARIYSATANTYLLLHSATATGKSWLFFGDDTSSSIAAFKYDNSTDKLQALYNSIMVWEIDSNRDLYIGGDTNNISWWDASEHRMVMLNGSVLQFCSDASGTATDDGATIYFDNTSDDDLYITIPVESGSIYMSAYGGVTIYHATNSPMLTLDYQNTADASDPYILFQENSGAGADDEWSLGMDTGRSNIFCLTAGSGLTADYDFIWTIAGRYGIGEDSPASALDIDDDAGGSDMGYITMEEISGDPSVTPAANHVALYAKDNGSGKTEIRAMFSSGTSVQLAVDP